MKVREINVTREDIAGMGREMAQSARGYVTRELRHKQTPARERELSTLFLLLDQRLTAIENDDPLPDRVARARDFLAGKPDADTRQRIDAARSFLHGPTADDDLQARIDEARESIGRTRPDDPGFDRRLSEARRFLGKPEPKEGDRG